MQLRLNRSFFPWIFFQFLDYWYYYIGAFGCLFCLHYFQSTIPGLAKDLGDKVLTSNISDISVSNFFLLSLAILFFRSLSRLLFFYPARAQQRDLRMEMVQRLETTLPEKYHSLNDGELFQVIVNDINRLRGLIGFGFLQIGNIIIASIIFIPKINEFNSEFLYAFLPLVFCIVLFIGLIYLFQPFIKKNMAAYAELQNYVMESYEAKKTIKNFHAEKAFLDKFQEHSQYELSYFFKSSMGRVFSFPMIKLGVGASLIWATYIVKDNGLGASDLIFFSGFLFLILEPLMALSWIGIVASQGYAAWGRIKDVVDKIKEPVTDQGDLTLTNFKTKLWAKEITLNIIEGKWNVLVGDTGSGKSYLLEQISKMLYLKGSKYSFIQQEPYLYNDTILKNIILNNELTPDIQKLIESCITEFGLDVLGNNIQEILDLEIGENGKKVSGGQAKRIALIRSLVSDVDVILWDDPFSSVDLILESQITKQLKDSKKFSSKTFIQCSHRISSVRSSDKVFYISKEDGLVEEGNTHELLSKDSKLYDYFKKQMV